MKTQTSWLVIVACSSATGLVPPIQAQTKAGPSRAGAGEGPSATCMINLNWDADLLRLDEGTLRALARSSGVADRAVQQALGLRPGQRPPEPVSISIDLRTTEHLQDSGMALVELGITVVEGAGEKATPDRILKAACDRLAQALRQIHEANITHLHQQLDQANGEFERAQAQMSRLQARRRQLLEQAGRANLSTDSVTGDLYDLEEKRRDVDMQLNSQQVRRGALEQRIAEIAEGLEARTANDDVLRELEYVVQLRERALRAMEDMRAAKKGIVEESHFPVTDLQEQLAKAKIELHQARKKIARQVGGDTLAEYSEELARVSIEAVELEARNKYLKTRLDQMRAAGLLELADEFDKLTGIEIPMAEDALTQVIDDRLALERRLRMATAPSLTVIGLEDAAH